MADVTSRYRGGRIGGPVFVVGFLASLVAGAALARTSLFLPGADAAQLRVYYAGSPAAVVTSALLQLFAAAGLVRFGLGVSSAVGAGRGGRYATWLTAGAFACSCALSLTLAGITHSASDGTLLFLGRATLALGGPLHLVGLAGLIWFGSRAASADERRPRWVLRFGTVVAPLMLVSLVSLALPGVTKVEPLWRLLAAVWVIAVSVSGLPRRAEPRGADRPGVTLVER